MAQATTFGRRGVVSPPSARAAPDRPAPIRPAPRTPAPAAQKRASAEGRTVLGYFLWLLFSFDGRLDRRTYRYCRFVANGGYLLTVYGFQAQAPALVGSPGAALALSVFLLVMSVLMIWTTLAMQVKRRHDRDKSWPWLFVGFIPIIGPFWVLIETCWLNGTPGYNRFDEPSKTAAATFA
ncbi:MAG TPA: DUF805 domain-containing protein [Caulobacteraceae bacterium]|nr:DUF805 domain-containing protein [Caulobacteraceae bacterium]